MTAPPTQRAMHLPFPPAADDTEMTPGTRYPDIVLTQLRLRHFRAFENARLVLDPMTLLVGRNGSGKSTIMEALDFLRDAVTDSLVNVLERRGGLQALRQRQSGRVAPYDVIMDAGCGALKRTRDSEKELGVEHYGRIALGNQPDTILIVIDSDNECASREAHRPARVDGSRRGPPGVRGVVPGRPGALRLEQGPRYGTIPMP